MTESLLKDMIDEALEERITDKVEFIKENEARKMADREFMLSVDNRWGDEGFLRCNTYFNVQEGVKKKAFNNLFDETFQRIYDKAYDITMESILMSDLFWNDRKVDEFYHLREMDRQFSIALEAEMVKSSKSIIKKITEMIHDDLDDAIEERFEPFKNHIAAEIRSHNKKRKKWAIGKLEKIQKKFERLGWNEENSAIIRNAEVQIEDFYTQFDIEVNIVEKKAKDMEITSYCFTNFANLYGDLKSKTMIDKKDKDHELFKDNYGDFIEKLWVDLEIDKEPCGCVTCTLHRGTWCKRIMRQRRINSPIRTCPVCQQEIPKDEYEVKKSHIL